MTIEAEVYQLLERFRRGAINRRTLDRRLERLQCRAGKLVGRVERGDEESPTLS